MSVRILLAVVFAVGLAVRLAHYAAIADTAFPQIPTVFRDSDMHATWQWAQTILAGDVLGRDTFHPETAWMRAIAPIETWERWWGGRTIFQQAPLYPYFMAVVLGLSHGSLSAVLLAQLLLGAAQPLVVFALARQVFGSTAGLFAAALVALHGPLVLYQGSHLRDWLPPLLEPLAVFLALRAGSGGRARSWGLAGAAVGVACLAKETAVLLAGATLAWLWWGMWAQPRRAVHATAWLLGGLLLATSPLAVRNVLVGAPVLAVSNRAAEGIIVGNAADSTPVGAVVPPSMRSILERSDGHLPEVITATLETWDGRWVAFVRHQWTKVRGLLDPVEVGNNLSYAYGVEISPVLGRLPGHGLLLPLGFAGLLVVLGTWRRHLLLLLVGLGTAGALVSSVVLARYRLMLVPLLAVYAGAGLSRLTGWVRDRRLSAVTAYVALVAGAAVLQQVVVPIDYLRQDPTFVFHYASYRAAADIYLAVGRPDRATAEIERLRARAEALRGRNARFATAADDAAMVEGDQHAQWARRLIAEGRRDEARRQVELAALRYSVRPQISTAHYNLALLYWRLDDAARTREALTTFLNLEPTGPRAERARRLLDDLPRP